MLGTVVSMEERGSSWSKHDDSGRNSGYNIISNNRQHILMREMKGNGAMMLKMDEQLGPEEN